MELFNYVSNTSALTHLFIEDILVEFLLLKVKKDYDISFLHLQNLYFVLNMAEVGF